MKSKPLVISISLFVIFFVVATVSFFLMKNAEPDTDPTQTEPTLYDSEEYDVSQVVEKIEFLKLNTYDEIKKYADEYPIYIQTSDDEMLFAIGELYVEDRPVKLFYKLNEDGSLNRFDGEYSYKSQGLSAEKVGDIVKCFNKVVASFFDMEVFGHDYYDENGAPMNTFDEQIYVKMLDGKATYGLTVIDESSTYWLITINVTDKEQMNFEFFRCFDLREYNDTSLNIDLRPNEETGE